MMYELVQAGSNTFYMDCPAKIGLYRTAEDAVVLIDSGNDKDAGRRILKILREQGWSLHAIYLTHSHADHIGGCKFLQDRTNCAVYAKGIERAFTENPILEPAFLYGGFPAKPLQNKFLMAQPSNAAELTPEVLPDGLELIPLPGHSFDMVGFRTPDDVVFLADSLQSEAVLAKYHIPFLYDFAAYMETLEHIASMQASLFIPSHAPAQTDSSALVQTNREKMAEILALIQSLLASPTDFEQLLQSVFNQYGLQLNLSQYVLVGSTIRSILSYLYQKGTILPDFSENRLCWKLNSNE